MNKRNCSYTPTETIYIILRKRPEGQCNVIYFLKWCLRQCLAMNPEKFFHSLKAVLRQKNRSVDFSPNWVVLGLYCSYTKFHIFKFYTFFVLLHKNARTPLKVLIRFFANIFGKKSNKCLQSAPSVLMYKYKNLNNRKMWNFVFLQ